ncbi:NAD(P)H-binding protein [Streptomyces sp. PSAA01]|uniref:NmrA family NAD(P)-binding protein n=1 Tax=Streptomyces sp. PSAA01 TaxID=2912762 RepID=UPI001F23055A|nr:NAD(P)H-binding protein [Streptomyces sp. PSAA01]MCG0285640.1 NAD(P)H-binding protein [Streptomyces sp. PSAA01]
MAPAPILVTGAAGSVGGIGRTVVEELRRRDLPVRAMVHREDERADALRATGAEVVAGDLTRAPDVVHALDGCGRMYFGMSVSSGYLEATVTTGAVAREYARLEVLVNMSQMTVSQMDFTSTTESHQHRLQWLGEQALDWSGLPVTHLRPTVFMENPLFSAFVYSSIAQEGTIRLPFGTGRTSPVAAGDVAAVVTEILVDPTAHIGKTYHLTGPASVDMTTMAAEFADALGRPVSYVDVSYEAWVNHDLRSLGLPDHVFQHLATMARLHAENRYDRRTDDIETITGTPATGAREFVGTHPEMFTA